MNDAVIERAKTYAKSQNISLSKMIEAYLDMVTRENKNEAEITITPLVESLIGVIDAPPELD